MGDTITYILAFLFGSFLLGLGVGNMRSPDWSDPEAMRNYLVKHATHTDPSSANFTLSFRCGSRNYVYFSGTGDVVQLLALDGEMPRKGTTNDWSELIAGTVGVPTLLKSAPNVYKVVSQTKGDRRLVAAALTAAGMITTFGIGFIVAFEDEPRCGEPAVRGVLTDSTIWRDIAQHRASYHIPSSRPLFRSRSRQPVRPPQ